MTNMQKFDRLRKLLDEAAVYARAIGKLDFDMQCCAPKDGMAQAGADMAALSDRYFRLTHSKRYARLIAELHENSDGLTPVQKKVIAHLIRFVKGV